MTARRRCIFSSTGLRKRDENGIGLNTDLPDLGISAGGLMTSEFLAFTASRGNDLSTPNPAFGFPGLKPGDQWCVVAARFLQAHDEGCAPKVHLAATHLRALQIVPLEVLEEHALDSEPQ